MRMTPWEVIFETYFPGKEGPCSAVCPCSCCDGHGSITVQFFAPWHSHETPEVYPFIFLLLRACWFESHALAHLLDYVKGYYHLKLVAPLHIGSFHCRLMSGRSDRNRMSPFTSCLSPSQLAGPVGVFSQDNAYSLNRSSSGDWWNPGAWEILGRMTVVLGGDVLTFQGWKAIYFPEMITWSLYSVTVGVRWVMVTARKCSRLTQTVTMPSLQKACSQLIRKRALPILLSSVIFFG